MDPIKLRRPVFHRILRNAIPFIVALASAVGLTSVSAQPIPRAPAEKFETHSLPYIAATDGDVASASAQSSPPVALKRKRTTLTRDAGSPNPFRRAAESVRGFVHRLF